MWFCHQRNALSTASIANLENAYMHAKMQRVDEKEAV